MKVSIILICMIMFSNVFATTLVKSNALNDIPQLTTEQITHYKNSTEWWYFDTENSEGAKIVLMFLRRDPLTIKNGAPALHVEIINKLGKVEKIYPFKKGSFYYTKTPDSNQNTTIHEFGTISAKIILTEDTSTHTALSYKLIVNLPQLSIDLDMLPTSSGFMPQDNGVFFRHKKDPNKIICANIATPRGSYSGTVISKKLGLIKFEKNNGYHDHPWQTDHGLNSYRQWHWGRLFGDDHSVVFADVKPQPEYNGEFKFLYFNEIDINGHVVKELFSNEFTINASNWKKEKSSLLTPKFPHTLNIGSSGNLAINIVFEELLTDIPLYARSKINYSLNIENQKYSNTGWVEYVSVPTYGHSFLASLQRLKYFFWRF